jgi:hypothetical protein
VFEGGLEGMDGALISVLALRSFKVWLAAVSSTRIAEGSRRDAAMRSFSRDMLKALSEDSAYEGAVQQDCEASFSGAAAADRLLRYSSVYV